MYSFCKCNEKIESTIKEEMTTLRDRLLLGVSKIDAAGTFIKTLSNESLEKQERVKKNQIESQNFLQEIEKIYKETE